MDQPIFTVKAHVFHIDPQTKRSWIPATHHAVNVSFFYDSARSLYRIISVEEGKAIINSTITPNMSFTKTSQKFGQWSDVRANTVYGLGFCSEPELNKFIEKFHEVKEATRAAAQQKTVQQNGTLLHTSSASTQQPSHIIAPPSSLAGTGTSGNFENDLNDPINRNEMMLGPSGKQPLAVHQRSQSLCGLQSAKSVTDSPKHITKMGSQMFLPQTSAEAQLKYENDRLKLALAQSSANAKKWEVELQTLKNNNTRLTNALQESTANVEEWKKQLSALKDENSKMRLKILEFEASGGNTDALAELKKEMQEIRTTNERLESQLEEKKVEIQTLKQSLEDVQTKGGGGGDDQMKHLWSENETLRNQVTRLQEQSDSSKSTDKARKGMLDQLSSRLHNSVCELRTIQHELSNLNVS